VKPYYEDGYVRLYHGDASALVVVADLLVSDPPYPNGAGHFEDGIEAARAVLAAWSGPAFVFWHQLETPPVDAPLVARHAWHRTNTNRPDNYEAIYEFNPDGRERPSRVFPHAVVYPGLTGCIEATGHPTQKPVKLLRQLLALRDYPGTVYDPFAGSGTTLRAAKDLGRRAVGCEINRTYCDQIVSRLAQEVLDLGGAA